MAAEQTVRIDGATPIPVNGSVSITGTVPTQEYANTASLHAAGTATNVTAGQAICTISNPPAGFYRVDVTRVAGGSGTPTLFNNGEFRVGATPRVLVSVPTLDLLYQYIFYVTVNGSQNLSINAVANGASNVTISASITATRMN
jgi:hypothetical protein